MFDVNVVSQPVSLISSPFRSNCTRQIAPRAVSATNKSPWWLNATPLATRSCPPAGITTVGVALAGTLMVRVPGGNERAWRPTPSPAIVAPSAVLFRIG